MTEGSGSAGPETLDSYLDQALAAVGEARSRAAIENAAVAEAIRLRERVGEQMSQANEELLMRLQRLEEKVVSSEKLDGPLQPEVMDGTATGAPAADVGGPASDAELFTRMADEDDAAMDQLLQDFLAKGADLRDAP